ncbi:MAG: hypothetical protein EAZ89_01995, partial [Bacteroidetes bacterium]
GNGNSFRSKLTKNDLKAFGKSKKRVLLLLHGTIGTTELAFKGLLKDKFFEETYADRIIGYDHPTIIDSVATNVDTLVRQLQALAEELEEPIELKADVITRSRGCLVLCELLKRFNPDEQGALKIHPNLTIKINKVVTVAPCFKGTPAVIRENIDVMRQGIICKTAANVIVEYDTNNNLEKKKAHERGVFKSISKAVTTIMGRFGDPRYYKLYVGLHDMDPKNNENSGRNDFMTSFMQKEDHAKRFHSLIFNYNGDSSTGLIDTIMGGENDYITPVDSAKGGYGWSIHEENFYTMDSSSVSHMNYFSKKVDIDENGVKKVIEWLNKGNTTGGVLA